MGFWENVKSLIANQGRSRAWLSRQTGISDSSLRTYISENRMPRVNDAAKIAEIFSTTIDTLMDLGSESKTNLDPSMQTVINVFSAMMPAERYEALAKLERYLAENKKEESASSEQDEEE